MTVTALDLTKDYPRSPFAKLDGVPWLPRVIDKVRALQAGKIGEYVPYPCGGDKRFLSTFGLDADAFKAQVDSGATDAEISAWVHGQLGPDWQQQAAEFTAGQQDGYPEGSERAGWLAESIAELKQARPELDTSKVINFPQLICVEEGHAY